MMIDRLFPGEHSLIKYYFLAGLAWSRTLNIPNAKVIRVSGLKKVDEYEIVNGQQVMKEKKELGDPELLKE